MTKLVTSFIFCIISRQVCSQMPEERGIVMSVYSYATGEKFKHLEKFPGYENMSNVLADGLTFEESNLRAITSVSGYNKALDTENMLLDAVHYGVSLNSIQIAVDWLSETIYWCDAMYKWIVAASVHKDQVTKDYFRVIINDHLDKPAGIAVDPLEGYLFWSDSGQEAKIERSDLTGKSRKTIVSRGVTRPSHMTVDISDKRIYWIHMESIHSANYDGTGETHITRYERSNFHDLAIFRDVLYVSDTSYDELISLNKSNGLKVGEPFSIQLYTIYGLAIYSEENQPKKDKDYCAEQNCDHLCISTKSGATCMCSDGYTLNQNTGKCEETNVGLHKAIVFASETHICYVDIRSLAEFYFEPICIFTVIKKSAENERRKKRQDPTPDASASPGDNIKLFDLNMKENIVYYANMDNKIYARQLLLPFENEAKELITTAGGIISGIAYDPVDTGDLYWCESDTGNIFMINVNDKIVTKVNLSNVILVKPRNILVLQTQRKLAWVSGEDSAMSIQTINMDGSELFDVVRDYSDIGALTVDQEQQIFYFLSRRRSSIYSIPVSGTDTLERYFVNLEDTANLILHYNKYIAWVYTDVGFPNAIVSYNYEDKKVLGRGYFDTETTIIDIKVLDEKLQSPERASLCLHQNGGCSQLCVTKYDNDAMERVCECQLGYKLQNDQKTCKTEVVNDNYLLVADWTVDLVFQINLLSNEINAIPIDETGSIMGLFYDAENEKLILSLFYDSEVYSMNLDGTNKTVLTDTGYSFAYRFAKDTIAGNIYYTAFTSAHIGVITPSGENIWLIDDFYWEDLQAIAVHPEKGYLYFSAIDSDSYIARANMDGSNVEKIIMDEHVQYPSGLAIDYQNDFLYWSDGRLDTIQRCNLDGEECETIVNNTKLEDKITDIVLDDKYLYYAAIKKSHVVQVSLTAPYTKTEVGYNIGLGKIDTLSMFKSTNQNKQKVGGGCSENGGLGDCSTICFPTSTGRTCACKGSIDLKQDGKTCSDIYQCTGVIKQVSNTNPEGLEIKLPDTCSRYTESKCKYTCPNNFIPTFEDNTLTCSPDGWDKENSVLCEETRCPLTIDNGEIDKNCQTVVGNTCDFTCNTGFQRAEQSAFCTKSGSWHKNASAFCKPYKCPNMITQVSGSASESLRIKLSDTCSRLDKSTCKFTCPLHFKAIVKDSILTCTPDGWDRENISLCEEMRCTQTIDNGKIDEDCEAVVGNTCDFTCDNGFLKTEQKTFCTKNGSWHKNTSAFCQQVTVTDQETQKGDGTWKKKDVLAVIIVCAVIVFALCVVVAVLIHRLIRGRGYLSKNEGTVVYEKEPKYIRDDLDDDRRRDSELSSGYIQPRLNGISEETVSTSMVNPLYSNEPLSAISQVLPKENTVSYSDWLKRQ